MYIKENENKTVVNVNDCKSIVKDTLQKLFINDYKTVEVSEKEVKRLVKDELEPHYVRLYNKTRKSYRKQSHYYGRMKSTSGVNTVLLRFELNRKLLTKRSKE